MKNPQARADTDRARSTSAAWVRRHRRPVGVTCAAAAAAMAVLWMVVVPEKAGQATGLQELAIRWGHPACWALLAGAGVLVAVDAAKRIRDGVFVAAALCYASFLAGMVL